MTKDQAAAELEKLQTEKNKELAHVLADEVLLKFLSALGYPDIVTKYEKIEKWYA
jgi:hypothetical protein